MVTWVQRAVASVRRFRLPGWFPDFRDVHVYGGLGLATFAGWQVVGWWAGVVFGLLLTVLGLTIGRWSKPQ